MDLKHEDDSDESDIEKLEEEVRKDTIERDELAKRIREREKKNTRNVALKSESKAAAEASKRLKISDSKDTDHLMDKLRYESRKDYLAKRKEDKTYELEALVRDDEVLFGKEERYLIQSLTRFLNFKTRK